MTWRRALAIMGAVAATGGAVWFGIEWANRGAQEAPMREAIERQRRAGGDDDGSGGFLLPAAGVYRYEAAGTEQLSLLATSQSWGATVPAAVTHDGDCWTLRFDFSTNHWQDERYCPADRSLREVAATQFQSFDFAAFTVGDTITFSCDPPVDAIRVEADSGDSWAHRCVGDSPARGTHVVSAGTTTFLGRDRIDVDRRPVDAFHYRLERDLSGDQAGTELLDRWYDVTDGLLLKETRDITVRSPSPIGDVTYEESGTLTLTSRQIDR